MDLTEIHRKTRLSLRKLRYVLDHRLLPATRVKTDPDRVGHPRSFTNYEGYAIAVAAALLEAGLRRDIVSRFFDAMTEVPWHPRRGARRPECPLLASFSAAPRSANEAKIADGRYLVIKIGPQETRWLDLQSPRFNPVEYDPRVIVAVDLGRIREELRSK